MNKEHEMLILNSVVASTTDPKTGKKDWYLIETDLLDVGVGDDGLVWTPDQWYSEGRWRVVLKIKGQQIVCRRHELIALLFLGPKPEFGNERVVVNHMDNQSNNDRPDNLEYVSNSLNVRHGALIRKAYNLGLSSIVLQGISANKLGDLDMFSITGNNKTERYQNILEACIC